jgi:GntR family transcriptional regulator
MEFNKNQPIYMQIADLICEKILLKYWQAGERIPSVRELAVSIQVNPNTVMRTYSFLQDEGIIMNQRGIGFFVTDGGYQLAKAFVTKQVFEIDMENLFKKMNMAGITFDEFKKQYHEYSEKASGGKDENN